MKTRTQILREYTAIAEQLAYAGKRKNKRWLAVAQMLQHGDLLGAGWHLASINKPEAVRFLTVLGGLLEETQS